MTCQEAGGPPILSGMTDVDHQTLWLQPHPADTTPVLDRIAVNVACGGRQMRLTYRLEGPADALRVPAPEEPVRADGLWQETCCEAFLKAQGGTSYYEVNLSPSGQWAVYRFDAYRTTMQPVDLGAAPVIDCDALPDGLVLHATIDLSMLPPDFAAADWQLGLSCVVEGRTGARAFWALRHPPEKPDFHHDHCFAHKIRAAERT